MHLQAFSLSRQLLLWQLSDFDNGEVFERADAALAVRAAENVQWVQELLAQRPGLDVLFVGERAGSPGIETMN
jgi:hypothetical protein